MNVQEPDDIVSQNFSSVSKTFYIAEKNCKLALASFQTDKLLFMRLTHNILRNKLLENLKKICYCRRKRIEVCGKISNVVVRRFWNVNKIKFLILLHFVKLSWKFIDIWKKPVKNFCSHKNEKRWHYKNKHNCNPQNLIHRAVRVGAAVRTDYISEPVRMIFVDSKIFIAIRRNKRNGTFVCFRIFHHSDAVFVCKAFPF